MPHSKTLSISAICDGTVIDHIPPGNALKIVRFLKLDLHHKPITLGLNLESGCMGQKDILKIDSIELSEKEASQVALFAPKATINIIRGYEVVKKFQVELPEKLEGIISCPNAKCITNFEGVETIIFSSISPKQVRLKCYHCSKQFTQHEIS